MRTRADQDILVYIVHAGVTTASIPGMCVVCTTLLNTAAVGVRLGVLRKLSSVTLTVRDQDTYIHVRVFPLRL